MIQLVQKNNWYKLQINKYVQYQTDKTRHDATDIPIGGQEAMEPWVHPRIMKGHAWLWLVLYLWYCTTISREIKYRKKMCFRFDMYTRKSNI